MKWKLNGDTIEVWTSWGLVQTFTKHDFPDMIVAMCGVLKNG